MLAIALVLAGAALSGRAAYQQAKGALAGILIRRAWITKTGTGRTEPPWPGADLRPVARIVIPRIGYDEIVLDNATPRTLAFGPTHMLNGADFGQHGNLLLAGHRDSWFLPLEKIVPGDEIRVEWFDIRAKTVRAKHYRAEFVGITGPNDLALLAATSEDALTLITCYPFGHARNSPQRFFVRAVPMVANAS
jgi:sortase A